MTLRVVIRGGGDLASGVAVRLFRAGCQVLICELEKPLCVRRSVSFAQAVYSRKISIEGITGELISESSVFENLGKVDYIPVIIDPDFKIGGSFLPDVVVDARMIKAFSRFHLKSKYLLIGIGPGFVAGENCHVVIETKRGFNLGRVYWQGSAENDTGIPEKVSDYDLKRVLRAPCEGIFKTNSEIGKIIDSDQIIGYIDDEAIRAPFKGLLRGLIHDGLFVQKGLKIGDLDPRLDKKLCEFVSDKALAIGGGVLEAILSVPKMRQRIGD